MTNVLSFDGTKPLLNSSVIFISLWNLFRTLLINERKSLKELMQEGGELEGYDIQILTILFPINLSCIALRWTGFYISLYHKCD